MQKPAFDASAAKPSHLAVIIAFVLVCLNLRIVYGGIGPLLPYMALDPVVVSALTAFPPLCMGLFAPFGAIFAKQLGEERALFLSIVLLTAGIVIRSLGSAEALLAGTVVASIGIAALNVLTPVFIRQNFEPRRIGVMMGVYAMMMGVGGGLMAALAVPLYHAAGGSWTVALGSAAVPAVLALAALAPLLGVSSKPVHVSGPSQPWHWLLRHPTAWSIVAFFGIHCLVFYVVLSWLPAIYVDKGAPPTAAGIDLAVSMVGISVGGFVGPTLAARRRDHRLHILGSIVLSIVGILGVLLAPAVSGPLWSIILGSGMGAGLAIPGVLYAKRTADRHHMAQLSGMVQTFGYPIAATGPVIAAALHGWSGGWTWPLGFVLVLLAVNGIIGLRGGRDHIIGGEGQ
ncbi:cyanate transporter [Xaviernesmea oryzae]|uniref:Cyanate transporter n=1 Tax=Xaviernesmea oryzae TaxID=464029 RepID=A0A1Q9B212_9HYPH|nr:MFS transporter [Xaviernesmea oryzae]OLP62054.1 cyanate transporter [Xaviernesmea oryzae]SEK96342.1 MFS transporter, CP family, cyanate transporter [Xaviernesmea oryzae]